MNSTERFIEKIWGYLMPFCVLGLTDMALQAATRGEFRLINTILTGLFN